MRLSNRFEATSLLLGDIAVFVLSLWITLLIRNFEIPEASLFYSHLSAFYIIFATSIISFYIAGLYEKQTTILKSRLPSLIFKAELANSVIAVALFYFIPYFGITPKAILFIYVAISLGMIVLWRLYISKILSIKKTENAILIGSGKEALELMQEINNNPNYGMKFIKHIDIDNVEETNKSAVEQAISSGNASIVVIDLENNAVEPIQPVLYKYMFNQMTYIPMSRVYEEVFKRVPLSLLRYGWFLKHISTTSKILHDAPKRLFDIMLSIVGGLCSLVFYPFVIIAIKLDDGGPIFITQERVGKNGKRINMVKFRSMNVNDRGVWVKDKDDRITRIGRFLRMSRIDELPQFWNVLKGDISLIGPRPDMYDLGQDLAEQIPYYAIRNVVTPGLSGWAVINQDLPPQSLEETRLRLAYDIYYIKNRSFFLDIKIILHTIRTLLSRSGR